MGPLDLLNHLVNLALPALAMALLLPLVSPWVDRGRKEAPAFWTQAAVIFLVGLAMLLGSLWFWGRDGKMAGYLALVLGCATAQWWLRRR